ncbi:MAG: rRNA maturation RNase YbeY [Hyphomonadaceae bacterium]|nr:rRNA maturation RNase YbeY [Hyphomonadaceae bacterium]
MTAEPMEIEIIVSGGDWSNLPDAASFCARVLQAAADAEQAQGSVVAMLSDDAMLRQLNRDWRGKDQATNVLSFPAAQNGDGFLGDIALAFETVRAEAEAQDKAFDAHVAHLLVHGFLHLLNYDHDRDEDAARMEARETAILHALGYPDPYRDHA